MVRIFALLIGIERYASPDFSLVAGAHRDIENVRTYLIDDLHVPQDHILTLLDEEATRGNIIAGFQSHLICNASIREGDVIIVHFSGHGSRSPAPHNWPIIEKTSPYDEDYGLLEIILPYDEGMVGLDGYQICGIPDRTLGALLDMVALSHGDNITVVLDCCHSGHGTRGPQVAHPFKVRRIDPLCTVPLREDVDQDVWSSECLRNPFVPPPTQNPHRFLRGAFTQRRAKSHVLMAACGQKESAMGTDDGGLFTTLWVKALRSLDIRPRSYVELLKWINQNLDVLRNQWPGIVNQHPQCEGVSRDRLVFEKIQVDPGMFQVLWEGRSRCRIQGPCEIMGVKPGTQMELCNMDNRLRVDRILGTAVVKEVSVDHCYAQISTNIRIIGEHHTARVLSHPYRLYYAVVNLSPQSPIALRMMRFLEFSLSGATADDSAVLQRVGETGGDLNLILEVDDVAGGGVALKHQDSLLRDQCPPRLSSSDMVIVNVPRLLASISRFNFFLNQTNALHPFSSNVHMEFHLLQEDPDSSPDDDAPLTRPKALRMEVPFQNDEAKIVERHEDDYAFVLRNAGSIDLFPYIIYFDPNTYEISIWYSPWEEDKPTLLAGQSLQIGASPELSTSFQFFLPDGLGTDMDTSFIKVFLADAPLQLRFLEQPPLVGRDEDGRSHVRQANRMASSDPSSPAPPQVGAWDSFIRKITVIGSL
ncbi:hypothetical protein QCA50_004791 [Cerrena zonata]|uniref:Peptidase C14 caspase domain-containing protein n=1 Tax=Cerrena zonata TaxID=2478898 RepID=A0AAW0GNA4_9APHY